MNKEAERLAMIEIIVALKMAAFRLKKALEDTK